MPDMLYLRWPKSDAGNEAARYARALEARVREFGITVATEPSPDAVTVSLAPGHGAQAPAPPLVSGLDACVKGAGTALACRPDPAEITVLAFADALLSGEAGLLGRIRDELASLAPYPVRFIVLSASARSPNPADRAAQAQQGAVIWRTLDDPELPRLLLAADVALVSAVWPRQGLLLAAATGIPALVHVADGEDPDPAGPGLAVSGATPRQLAGLLLLLVVEPGLRRKVLDTQDALRRSLQPAAQRRAVQEWLDALGFAPSRFGSDDVTPACRLASEAYRVEGVFDSSYSLAIVNRQLALALEDEGETVALYSYEQGDDPCPAWQAVEVPERLKAMWALGQVPCHPAVSLRNAWPPVVRDMRARRRVLASYAWEETVFPPEFAEEFNLTLDLVTVVSTQTARLLRDAGVHTPMAVVGNGVDHLLGVQAEPMPQSLPPARFRFLHVSSCFPRKGADVLLKAYGEAFDCNDDVVLVIKTFPNPHNDVRAQLADCRRENPRYPRVELIESDWTSGQIVGLYRNCHALVAPSRAEGFGLPIAEAMLYRLPVIVTGWGGHMDFCRDDNCWLLDYVPERARTHLGQADSLWAEPSAIHLAALMRMLYAAAPEVIAEKTARAREGVLARYTWRQVAARTRAALRMLDARPGLSPKLRVGWVSTWGSRCGVAAYSQHLVGAFSGDELRIFAPAGEDTDHDDWPNVDRNWVLGAGNLDRLIADARAQALDALVVQFHWAFFGLDALAALLRDMRAAGVRVILEFHNTRSAPQGATAAAFVDALAGAERLLVHTLDDMQRLKALGLSANVTLFPLAVYPIRQPDPAAIEQARRRLGLDDRQVVASYGFLMPHKGLLQLVEAMPALLAARPRLHLLMVNALYSPEVSGTEHQRILDRIAELGLAAQVTLVTDFLPEEACVTLLKTADLVVFPYQNTEESSSAAVRMALVANCPTAVTPLAIFDDVAPAVFTLPGVDRDSLAGGIAHLLEAFDEQARRAAAHARTADFVAARGATQLSRRLRGLILGSCNDIAFSPEAAS